MAAAILSAAFGNLVVAAALAAAAFAAGRRAKWHAVARGAWLLVLVKLLTPPLVTVPVRCFPPRPPTPAAAPDVVASAAPTQSHSSPQVFASPGPTGRTPLPPTQAAGPTSSRFAIDLPSVHWTTLLLGVWLTGSGA